MEKQEKENFTRSLSIVTERKNTNVGHVFREVERKWANYNYELGPDFLITNLWSFIFWTFVKKSNGKELWATDKNSLLKITRYVSFIHSFISQILQLSPVSFSPFQLLAVAVEKWIFH